jgi:hypothetical protein
MVVGNYRGTGSRRYCAFDLVERRCGPQHLGNDVGIVNALLDRLTDNSLEVKLDALQSLDALLLKQGQSTCKEIYRKNIVALLGKIVTQVLFLSIS